MLSILKLNEALPTIVQQNWVKSKSEFYRLVQQNGVALNQQKLTVEQLSLVLQEGDVLQMGKKRFLQFTYQAEKESDAASLGKK